jgi:arsenite methyltransferase
MAKDKEKIRKAVRQHYGDIARKGGRGCCGGTNSSECNGGLISDLAIGQTAEYGYSPEDIKKLPKGADLGLGCGNPLAIASILPGETVVDLGSGGGIDCFLAAAQVGQKGRVIGVDMTPEMLGRARKNASEGGYTNVIFRLGEIENLPIADNSVDLIISNCVVNLSPDKPRVFAEAFRVLKPGGRIAISDIVATSPLPVEIENDLASYAACISGAALIADLETMLKRGGFIKVKITPKDRSREFIKEWIPGKKVEDYIISATIEAVKPHKK